MGYQLWASEVTGYRRRGTRLAELRDLLGDRITARSIYEPLLSCPSDAPSCEMLEELQLRDFDVAGVRDERRTPVLGYVEKGSLSSGVIRDNLQPIQATDIVDQDTILTELLNRLCERRWLLVSIDGDIEGIITLTDLNKPIVRVYLFGLISLLEMHLAFWIRTEYAGDSWKEVITPDRVGKALEISEARGGTDPMEFLQYGDRRSLFAKNENLRARFEFRSIGQINAPLESANELRDDLAHSQNYLATPDGWAEKIKLILWIDNFIQISDQHVEDRAELAAQKFNGRLV